MKRHVKARSMSRRALMGSAGRAYQARQLLQQIKHPTPGELTELKLVRTALRSLDQAMKVMMAELRAAARRPMQRQRAPVPPRATP